MFLQLVRLQDNGKSTIGTLHLNGEFEAFTLEDTFNEPKIYGKTRIPDGTYEIKLRTEGGMTKRYGQRFGDIHEGMLWLQDVPGFEWVYLHIGNKHEHTEGCMLVGGSCDSLEGTIGNSRTAYTSLYKKVIESFSRGEEVTIQII